MKNLFSAKGRLRRRDCLIISFISAIIYLLLILIMSPTDLLVDMFILILWLGILIINIMADIKRFHDIEYSGWCFLLLFVPVINIGGAFLLTFKDGTIGPNKYGDDPKKRTPKEII